MSHVHPTRDDELVAALSEVVGGPVGEHAGPARSRSGTSVLGVLLALTALTFALGLLTKTSCALDGWPTDGESRYTHACVSEVPDAYSGTGLVELAWPWSSDEQTRLRYPVTQEPALVGLWSYAAARVTHVVTGSPDVSTRYEQPAETVAASDAVDRERRVFVVVNAVGFALLAMAATWALSRVHRRRPWDAAAFAAAPVLGLAGIVSWDLLAVTATAGALWAFAKGRPVLAGALVGVGAAAGLWPVLLLAAHALVSAHDRAVARVLPPLVTATAVWGAINAPAFVTGRSSWETAWTTAWDHGPDQGSIWTIVDQTAGLPLSTGRTVVWVLVALWIAAVAALTLLAPERPRLSQVTLLLVAGVLMLGLSYEPEQALWLLPLAALARPRWRDLLVWQAGEAVYLAMLFWWRGGLLTPGSDRPDLWYWVAIVVHVAGTVWLVAAVVRDVWWPERDPVRMSDLDDEIEEEPESVLV